MPPLPPGTLRIDADRAEPREYGRPVYFDQRLYGVEATHIDRNHRSSYYFVLGDAVWHSANRDGPFFYLGRRGEERMRYHEEDAGLSF